MTAGDQVEPGHREDRQHNPDRVAYHDRHRLGGLRCRGAQRDRVRCLDRLLAAGGLLVLLPALGQSGLLLGGVGGHFRVVLLLLARARGGLTEVTPARLTRPGDDHHADHGGQQQECLAEGVEPAGTVDDLVDRLGQLPPGYRDLQRVPGDQGERRVFARDRRHGRPEGHGHPGYQQHADPRPVQRLSLGGLPGRGLIERPAIVDARPGHCWSWSLASVSPRPGSSVTVRALPIATR